MSGPAKHLNVEINPGRLCNNKCVFCMSGEERDDHEPWAALERLRAELRHHRERGATSVGFLGGEPTAYPHILEAMRSAKTLGYTRVALCTNGMRLADPGFVEEALEAGLTRVTLSLHSHLPEIEEALVQVPGILAKKLRAIDNLVRARAAGRLPDNISLNPVLNRLNAPHLEAFARSVKARGIDDIRFNFIWPQSRILTDTKVVPRLTEIVPYMLGLVRANEAGLGMSLSFGAVPFCVLPPSVQARWPLLHRYFHEEGVDHPTEVSFINPDRDGTVNRFNLKERTRFDHRTQVAACLSCRFRKDCLGVWETYVDLYGDSEFRAAREEARAR